MTEYTQRSYRKRVTSQDLVCFQVAVKETDLCVSAERNLEKETRDAVLNYRNQLETYIRSNPAFLTTLEPYEEDRFAPPIVREMIRTTRKLGVGPMASVAGAIAQFVGKDLLQTTKQVIVENGGDIFLKVERPAIVSIFAGSSPLSERVGLRIPVRHMPLGVCASSGTVGHSHSEGRADVVCILSSSAVRADGAATALGNRLKRKGDLEKIGEWAHEMGGIRGGVAIMGDTMASWGDVELVALK